MKQAQTAEQTAKDNFVERETKCPLCNSTLDIHISVTPQDSVSEEASCPKCQVITRIREHQRMH